MTPKQLKYISNAKLLHGNKFDYSNTFLTKLTDKVLIGCKVHGDVEVRAGSHTNPSQKTGCPKCSGRERMTAERFILKGKEIHGDKYDYSTVIFTENKANVSIICKIHGEFKCRAQNHYRKTNPTGCPECGKLSKNRIKEQQKVILDFKSVHGNLYDYSKVIYIGQLDKITIICKEHGEFLQNPKEHFKGHGCQKCGRSGYDVNKPGILYYIKIKGFYKIGITNKKSVEERFNKSIKILKTTKYLNGQEALDEENRILKEFKIYRYTGNQEILGFQNGNTELFKIDILKLDTTIE